MNLHLFDVSEYVYSGSRNTFIDRGYVFVDGRARPRGLYCGGIAYMLDAFREWSGPEEELVFCIDRTPTVKRQLFESEIPDAGQYKGCRSKPRPEITVQKAMIEDVLRRIGANVVAVDGYEADDVIASLVYYYREDYDHVYIHAKDSDLFYLVDETVEIMPLNNLEYMQRNLLFSKRTPNGKHIDMDNWERSVLKGRVCKYNAILYVKLLEGDKSDNIPGVYPEIAERLIANEARELLPNFGREDFLREYVAHATDSDRRSMAILRLLQPYVLPYDEVCLDAEDINERLLHDFSVVCQSKYMSGKRYKWNEKVEVVLQKYIEAYIGVW